MLAQVAGSVSRGVIGIARLGAYGTWREGGPFLFRETETGVQLVARLL